jgi:hypothetical protein
MRCSATTWHRRRARSGRVTMDMAGIYRNAATTHTPIRFEPFDVIE